MLSNATRINSDPSWRLKEFMSSPMAPPSDFQLLLFNNLKFFLSATVPQRSWCAEQITSHGGKVVHLEKAADIFLVDNMRKDLPQGSYSFKFIDRCLRAGKLLDLEDFRAGPAPGSIRPVGSISTPSKKQRAGFSAKDDQILYDWVKPFEQQGGPIRGNKIYQQLEQQHPQHTYQSWRDRYLRTVKDRPRPVAREDNPGGQAPSIALNSSESSREPLVPEEHSKSPSPHITSISFSDSEEARLFRMAPQIIDVDTSREAEFWEGFSLVNTRHTASEWKSYFDANVRPKYVADSKEPEASSSQPASPSSARVSQQSSALSPRIALSTKTIIPPPQVQGSDNGDAPLIRMASNFTGKRKRNSWNDGVPHDTTSGDETELPSRKRQRTAKDTEIFGKGIVQPSVWRHGVERESTIASLSDTEGNTARAPNGTSPFYEELPIELAGSASRDAVPSSHSSANSSQSSEKYETALQGQSTQAIFADPLQHSQELDDLLNGPLPNIPDTAEPLDIAEDEKEVQELDVWIESRLRTGRAKDEDQITQALSCTSMNPFVADIVLDYLKEGKAIPTDIPGIWTEEDDHLLVTGNHNDVLKLQKKHGVENADIRGEYLNNVRQLELEDEEASASSPVC
ncbi:hypothetical protein LOZ61_005344 [Ophidiomyces ophidiicola]|nr:hypothetical protein LOZ61_005344 [Ophidiomyces ophidiicola]KAI1922323.1 hypothetical protein LOZ60_005753 [Ophidiomyces ophidiicola]KAI1968820.1 hypothetical protein LOZ56_004756 [Ophidiomyces ophidiicola]KAI2007940.1 hypothetical protein LOZ49_004429 [Ophidiomyces ophidiicola]KAI2028428.1 hypothetical protein LOZ45_002243 [Ophidiomyces ophidiicola]